MASNASIRKHRLLCHATRKELNEAVPNNLIADLCIWMKSKNPVPKIKNNTKTIDILKEIKRRNSFPKFDLKT